MILFFDISTTIKIFEIIAKCACEMIIFSNTLIIVNTFEIFAVFAYKMTLFFDSLKNLKTCIFEIFESAYDFDISNLQSNYLISCNCDENKTLFLWILDIFRYLFYEFSFLRRTTWSIWFDFRCQYCFALKTVCCLIENDLMKWCWKQHLAMKENCWKEITKKWLLIY